MQVHRKKSHILHTVYIVCHKICRMGTVEPINFVFYCSPAICRVEVDGQEREENMIL